MLLMTRDSLYALLFVRYKRPPLSLYIYAIFYVLFVRCYLLPFKYFLQSKRIRSTRFQRLEEQFAEQLEDQEAIYGPAHPLPPDLAEPVHHRSSTRSSLSSVSAD